MERSRRTLSFDNAFDTSILEASHNTCSLHASIVPIGEKPRKEKNWVVVSFCAFPLRHFLKGMNVGNGLISWVWPYCSEYHLGLSKNRESRFVEVNCGVGLRIGKACTRSKPPYNPSPMTLSPTRSNRNNLNFGAVNVLQSWATIKYRRHE